MRKVLTKSIIVFSLLFLFLVGIYIGGKTSYSVNVEEENRINGNTSDNGVLFLSSIKFEGNEAKADDKVYVSINSSGASLDGATINLTRSDGKYNISLNVKGIYEKPYVEIPKYVNTGEYLIKSVLLVGNNSDGSTFSKNFTVSPKSSDDVLFNFNNKIKLVANPNNLDRDLIKSIKLNTTSFRPGSKVPLEIDYDKDIRVVRINFTLGTYRMYSYINSIARNPYIIIPQSAKMGEYVLDEIYVETYNYGSVSYTFDSAEGTKYLAYDSRYYVLSESNSEEEVVYYSNEELSSEIISQIHSSEKIRKVEVMSEDSPVVSQDLFAAIKGLDKKLIVHYKDVKYEFEGNKVEKEKAFNASVDYKLINKDSDYSKYVNDGLVIDFAANGDLPGTAKVTLQKNSLFNTAFKQDHVNVYYYDEENKKFELIKEDLIVGKDAISFDITHTSTYVVTNSKINNSVVYSPGEKEKTTEKKEVIELDKDNIMLIAIVILAVIVVILIIILLAGNNKEANTEKKVEKKVEKEEKIVEKEEEEEEEQEVSLADGYEGFDEEELRKNISEANDKSFDEEDE